jgi:hypothetical protein
VSGVQIIIYICFVHISDQNNNFGSWSWSDGTKFNPSTFENFNGQTPVNRQGVQDCFHIFTGRFTVFTLK